MPAKKFDQNSLRDEIADLNENLKLMKSLLKARDENSTALFGVNFDTVISKLDFYDKIKDSYNIKSDEKMKNLAEVLCEERIRNHCSQRLHASDQNQSDQNEHRDQNEHPLAWKQTMDNPSS